MMNIFNGVEADIFQINQRRNGKRIKIKIITGKINFFNFIILKLNLYFMSY